MSKTQANVLVLLAAVLVLETGFIAYAMRTESLARGPVWVPATSFEEVDPASLPDPAEHIVDSDSLFLACQYRSEMIAADLYRKEVLDKLSSLVEASGAARIPAEVQEEQATP